MLLERNQKTITLIFSVKRLAFQINTTKLKCEFNLTDEALGKAFWFLFPIQLLLSHMPRPFSIELHTLYEFKTKQNRVHCWWSMFFLQMWIRNNAAFNFFLLLIGKLYLCRRNKELPSIRGFQSKVKLTYETENYICINNNNLDMFRKKWAI